MEKLCIFISTLLVMSAQGILLNSNRTHEANMEERLASLEKKLAEETKQRFFLQIDNDQEKEKITQLEHKQNVMNETDQELLQHYNAAPKRFQDISTQIRGALLSINTMDSKHNIDNKKLVDALNAVQTIVANLALNQSDIVNVQRNFKEKEKVLFNMINAIKQNQSLDREERTSLKTDVTSLGNRQKALQSTVNENVNKQNSLQSQISKIRESVLFLAIPKKKNSGWWNLNIEPTVTQSNIIKFPLAKINVGGGYDNNTGVFTCPSDGYYVFHWSVTSPDSNKRCASAIIKNGAEMIGNEVGGNQATFHMNRNDRAWIKATSNCTIVSYHSSFSGFKLI